VLTVAGRPYTRDDARGTLRSLGMWWEELTDGRPADAVVAIARRSVADLCRLLGAEPIADDLLVELHRLGLLAAAGPGADAPEVLEVALAGLREAGEALRAAGALPATAAGSVTQLNVSGGGVPKRAVGVVEVDFGGVAGDRQATRRHHGRPWQALCLWSKEVIEGLAAEGHPIAPGYAGENVTIEGVDWADVRSGVRLRLGDVLAEVSVFALPCASNAPWFLGGDFTRMHHERGPVSRVYASVLEPGRIAVGDPVVLEPGSAPATSTRV
jgi:MOSC domain-containing protein YiiM